MTTVFTDLDGTLLDEGGVLGEEARASLRALKTRGLRVVLLTSKSEPELRSWLERTGADLGAFENGAGTVGPGGVEIDPAAVPVRALAARLREMERRTGVPLVPLTALSDAALREKTGLSAKAAARARLRAYDLPFLAPARSAAALRRALDAAWGVSLVRGGIFWHLSGRHGKGSALKRLAARYGLPRPWVGLGDAPNDVPFLRRCDAVALLPSAGGVPARLKSLFPGAFVAREPGGAGWSNAVRHLAMRTRR